MKMNERAVFVTLFNSRYMSRGLTMYESLKNAMNDFLLYIIAFDDKAYQKLNLLKLDKAVIISLNEFEDEELLRVKSERNSKEYCWTCSSKSIAYILDMYGHSACTYIDADLFFFSNPLCLIEEMDEKESVLITEHRYSEYCDQTEVSGKYCVQFVTFKNNEKGRNVLKWWTERCIEWCFDRREEGRFGDQVYLNQFCSLFDGVHELQHLGGGVAPWNAEQYTYYEDKGKVYLRVLDKIKEFPVIFYHFEAMTFFDKDVVRLSAPMYRIPDTAIAHLYKTYIRKMEMVCHKYNLIEERGLWMGEEHFRDDDMDNLQHQKLYYNYSLFT